MSAPDRIRIVSDGTPAGTHVYNPDGTPITGVQKITWTLDAADKLAVATVELGLVEVELTAENGPQTPPS